MTPITIAHTRQHFERWLQSTDSRLWCEYHRGLSLYHNGPGLAAQPRGSRGKETRVQAAEVAWLAHKAGLVVLFQRKHGEADYSWLAMHRTPRGPLVARTKANRRRVAPVAAGQTARFEVEVGA